MNKIGTDLPFAASQLRAGKLVGIPTETVYGLAANALEAQAVASIFEAKNRPAFDPLIVHLANFEQAAAFCTAIPDLAYRLAATFCPGPITFILPKNHHIPDLVSAGQPTVGIRIPNHPLTLQLLQQLDFPLAAPSANPFGYVSPTTAQHVADQLGDKIAYILDGGPCEIGLESTIIDLSIAVPKVLRLGGLALEQLEAAVGQKLTLQTSSSNPKAPGMLLKHYAPNKKLIWADAAPQTPTVAMDKTAWLRFSEPLAHVPLKQQLVLSPSGDFKQAASRLFALLRELDQSAYDLILVEKAPETGLGRAINDRLKRAVTP
jgi:L-threonylcarbamoyladenylate synthase